MAIIYVLSNKVNGKCYVGQTTMRMSNRLRCHEKGIFPINRALQKYGREQFAVYQYRVPRQLLDDFEIELISRLNSTVPNGYNISPGGRYYRLVSESTRIKQSKMRRGENNHMYGKHLSEATRRKISETLTGRKTGPLSVETKRRMSLAKKGKHFSPEHRRNIALARIGMHPTEETRKRLSMASRGRLHTQEARIKISVAKRGEKNPMFGRPAPNRGIKHSPETRAKISAAIQRALARGAMKKQRKVA